MRRWLNPLRAQISPEPFSRLPKFPLRRHASSTHSPSPSSHNSLPTFLAYARTTGLSRTSTLFIGTHYEYTVQLALRRLGFVLRRTGARNDLGIDLVGTWALPSLPFPIRVVVQCKALRNGVGPNLIRELEGSLGDGERGRAGGEGERVMGVLVATGKATKGIRDALGRSGRALGWFMVDSEGRDDLDDEGGRGKVRQILWNQAAREIGLEGVEVGMRYRGKRKAEDTEKGKEEDEEKLDRECVLTWKGKTVDDFEEGQDEKR